MITRVNCKINLGLDILRRRPDGYHDIATVMVPAPWYDILEVVRAANPDGVDTLTVTGNAVDCPPEKNLVMKAVRAMRARYDFDAVDIYLHKIIPDGAGLGGGSADAAFCCRLINDIFNLGASRRALAEIVATVGSDCPFFIYNEPMLCTGTGTTMEHVNIGNTARYIVIAKPQGVSVSTAEAYAGVTPEIPAESIETIVSKSSCEWPGHLNNAFEPSVFAAAPAVSQLKDAMYTLGAVYASMSGSGAAVYGLFDAIPRHDELQKALGTPIFIASEFAI